MQNAIINAQKIANKYSYKTLIKGIEFLEIKGVLEERNSEYSDSFWLKNDRGEIDLTDALYIAAQHEAEITISFKFTKPVDLSGKTE